LIKGANMSDEKKDTRTNIEDLPQAEQELTTEEAKEVQGGLDVTTSPIDANATGRGAKPDNFIRVDTSNMRDEDK
jgi:hypothetical protein